MHQPVVNAQSVIAPKKRSFWRSIYRSRQLYVLFAIPLAFLLLFKYYPMLGIQIAFKDFKAVSGIWGSPWVGFKHFTRLFSAYQFERTIVNTISLSLYSLIGGLPFPILLALSLNYMPNVKLRKAIQTISYAPHFISTVVMCGMILQFLSSYNGIINTFIKMLGGKAYDFIGDPKLFSTIYVWSGIWQNCGYNSIIYIAALTSISPELHEAAVVDGASVLRRVWHIDLPGILPTIIILLIMNMGQVLNTGFEKILLLQNPMNLRSSEVLDTWVYKLALSSNLPNFSYSTAVGLFKSLVGLTLVLTVNQISRRVSEISLW